MPHNLLYTSTFSLKENTHIWIHEFCEKCRMCIKSCPANAIYDKATEKGRCIDHTKCAVPFSNDFGCSVCIKSCAFFKTNYESIKLGFEKQKNKQ